MTVISLSLNRQEKDDHSEDETQVEEQDPVTKESRDVVREPLRLLQRCLRSKRPLTNRREKLLFLEAVSKQQNAWQENAAATEMPQGEATVTEHN